MPHKYEKEDTAGGLDLILGCLMGAISVLFILMGVILLFTWIVFLIKG